jgi:tetratricopeptide (TPR) repeat protein
MSEPHEEGTKASALCRRAQTLIELRRYAEAVPVIRRAIAADPQEAEAHCLLAWALLSLEQYPEALEAAGEGAAADPFWEWPHRLRSIVFSRLGQDPEAVAAAREAARLAAEEPLVLYRLACCEWSNGERQQARETAGLLLEVAPEKSSTFEVLAWFAVEEGKPEEAEEHARKALRVDPESWQAYHYLGMALRDQRRKRQAIEAFYHAARLNPGDADVRRNLLHAIEAYTTGVFILVGVLLALVPALLSNWVAPPKLQGWLAFASFVIMLLVAAAAIVWQHLQLKKLPPAASALYKSERRRLKR